MARYTKRFVAVGAAAAMAASLAACGSGGSSGGGSGSNGTAAGSRGGTLNVYFQNTFDHTDPQRTYLGLELSNWKRTVYRSLVNFPISSNPKTADTPMPDLATTTGTKSNQAKTWSFTLKKGIKWQDGKPITCEDFKYGASRVFATDTITGGPNYLLSYLDIPTKNGQPAYDGPYKGDGQKYFDKAITCDGNTITYHFKKPWPDFPEAVAALNMMDPYRKDKDQGNKSNYQIFSNGPYKLQGGTMWSKEHGGTFVRNPNYSASTDSKKLREANPNKIVFNVGQTDETIYSKLIADSGPAQSAITDRPAPPSVFPQITGAVKERSVDVMSPFVDYLQPNVKVLKNLKVRRALYYATNTKAWIDAGGGTRSYAPAHSIVNPAVKGYKPNPYFDAPPSGDIAKAKKLLKQAGVKTPYPLTFMYESTPTADKQAAALKATWDKAGFKTTLDGIANSDTYYTNIQNPKNKASVVWAGWGADWPSAITVTLPLFDSVQNGVGTKGATSNGQDYGNYQSAKVNKLFDQAQSATDLSAQTTALQAADKQLGHDVAYIPLEIQKFNFLYGSNIKGFMTTPPSAMYPDLGPIAVK
ncbi:MAG: ABC transporter substrate-binding protein [Marmoricola sp.]